jgi:hypothetical protein
MSASRRRFPALLTALLAGALCAGLLVSPGAAAGGVTVTQTVTNQWNAGYEAAVAIRNDTGAALRAWRLEFDMPHRIASIWDAVLVGQAGDHVVIEGAPWQRDIANGATLRLGYVAGLSGARRDPVNCRLNGMACSFGGGTSPSTTVTSTTTPSTTVTTTAPTTSSSTTTTTAPPAPGGVAVAYRTTDTWDSGYNGQIDITNGGSSTLNGWTLRFKLSGAAITNMWNATYSRGSDGTYTVRNESWNGLLAAGKAASVGFGATGTPAPPTDCTINGAPCRLGGSGTTTTTTTAPPSTTSTSTTTTIPGGGGGGGTTTSFAVAPYVDATLWPTIDLPALARASGVKHYTLGFIVNGQGSCRATWGTYYNLDDNWLGDQVVALRAMGGDVIVSFGGAANQELALVCGSVDALAAQYRAVIDRYGLTSVDFDIEGAATADPASVDRRSKAIAKVQQDLRAAGRPLQVSLTLPVLPTGLTQDGVNVVKSARDNGVDVAVVNVMAMDYGLGGNPAGQMGTYAVQAATSTHGQLRSLYPSRTDTQLWAMVGVTPMIGQNDIAGEVFTVADARQLTDFARQKHLGRLAMWSANRDKQCAEGVKTWVDNHCSGVFQSPDQFATTFAQFTG